MSMLRERLVGEPSTSKPVVDNVSTPKYEPMPPVFTPLNEDLTVNLEVIPAYAQYLADAGIKSVLVGSTTGEHKTLSPSDRKKVIEAWVAVSKTSGLHIQVLIGLVPLENMVEQARYCQAIGVHSLVILPEDSFNPSTFVDVIDYLSKVTRAAPKLSVFYYHTPGTSQLKDHIPGLIEVASISISNFEGLKLTSNDLSEMFLGDKTRQAADIMSSIETTFNLFPKLAQDILTAANNNEVQKACELQDKLRSAIEAHTCEGHWIPTMKTSMEIVSGIKVGPPLEQNLISTEAKQRIQSKLESLELVN